MGKKHVFSHPTYKMNRNIWYSLWHYKTTFTIRPLQQNHLRQSEEVCETLKICGAICISDAIIHISKCIFIAHHIF